MDPKSPTNPASPEAIDDPGLLKERLEKTTANNQELFSSNRSLVERNEALAELNDRLEEHYKRLVAVTERLVTSSENLVEGTRRLQPREEPRVVRKVLTFLVSLADYLYFSWIRGNEVSSICYSAPENVWTYEKRPFVSRSSKIWRKCEVACLWKNKLSCVKNLEFNLYK